MRTAYIGMGANLPSTAGEPEATLAAAAARFAKLGRVAALSSLYSTTPVGFAEQPRFINAVARVETSLSPFSLLGALLLIEQEFGRDRRMSMENRPRTLDLDILLYSDYVLGGLALNIPHPRLVEREFVLVPMNEIAPDVSDPRTGRAMSELLQRLVYGRDTHSDAVVPLQSEVWRAVGSGGAAGRG